jgi:uncharacterized protein (DUF4415 family)
LVPIGSWRILGDGSTLKGEYMQKVKNARSNEVRALKRMKDREIDTMDIPPLLDWSNAVVGKFYRPIKKSLRIQLDADVLAWLKGQGEGYQTRINGLLRSEMERALSKRHGNRKAE